MRTALKYRAKPLPDIGQLDIDRAFDSIEELVTVVHDHFSPDTEVSFKLRQLGGAEILLYLLKQRLKGS